MKVEEHYNAVKEKVKSLLEEEGNILHYLNTAYEVYSGFKRIAEVVKKIAEEKEIEKVRTEAEYAIFIMDKYLEINRKLYEIALEVHALTEFINEVGEKYGWTKSYKEFVEGIEKELKLYMYR